MNEKFFAARGQSTEVLGSRGQLSKEIDSKEEKNELIAKKKKVQDWLTGIDMDVSYHNMFDKNLTSFRKDYNRYLICRVDSVKKMNFIFEEAKKLGYLCTKGPTSPNFNEPNFNNASGVYQNEEEVYKNPRNYNFSIDLESVKI